MKIVNITLFALILLISNNSNTQNVQTAPPVSDWDKIKRDLISTSKSARDQAMIKIKSTIASLGQSADELEAEIKDALKTDRSVLDKGTEFLRRIKCKVVYKPTPTQQALCKYVVCGAGRFLNVLPDSTLRYLGERCICECAKDDPRAFAVLSKALSK